MEVTRVFLEHGVDPNARDPNNATLLHLVSNPRFRGKGLRPVDFVQLLLQYNADIDDGG